MSSDHSTTDQLILEGIVTTLNDGDGYNVAPMGPLVDREVRRVVLRPFQTSRTFTNLQRHPQGVLHVVDDARLLARGAINAWDTLPPCFPARKVEGVVLEAACHWYEFVVESCDTSQPRSEIRAKIVHREHQRDFFGWNRAKHAVLEAAILATRIHLLGRDHIETQLDELQTLIDKTAGDQEREAFDLIRAHVAAADD